jgi:bifunctional non-homologous end joining protein LigD
VRALAAVQGRQWRLWGRELADYTERYSELDVLRRLPAGSVVDGELVVFQNGCADLNAILRRHQLVSPLRIRQAGRQLPVRYVLFDILYQRGRCLMHEPFQRRREVLADVLTKAALPELIFLDGIAGRGQDFFERVVAQGHEGIMAKHLASRYRPGQRSSAWRKIKPTQVLPCVIIGYRPSRQGIHSLLVASAQQGPLRYVAQVSSGFTDQVKMELGRRLARSRRPRPLVTCAHQAVWVEPDLYCRVRYLQWTPHGRLRGASFQGLIGG